MKFPQVEVLPAEIYRAIHALSQNDDFARFVAWMESELDVLNTEWSTERDPETLYRMQGGAIVLSEIRKQIEIAPQSYVR